jgi:tetratricopeptide (TPR) repeat protein
VPRWAAALAVLALAGNAHADYIEHFIGWSKDGRFYAKAVAGTDEVDVPELCLSRRGDRPPSWPKDVALPEADDESGCTPRWTELFEGVDADVLVKRARALVETPGAAEEGPKGQKVTLRAAADKTLAELTISLGAQRVARAYFAVEHGMPDDLTPYWRADGQVAAVEVGFKGGHGGEGFGPPAYLIVLPLDGSAANAERPMTERERAQAQNRLGMAHLKAGQLGQASADFAEAVSIDRSFALAHYNLASAASLRHDTNTAVQALLEVIDLASHDPVAKRALARAQTDHDLDFIAQTSPYVSKLLGRPTQPEDAWCIGAEPRARDRNRVGWAGVAAAIATALEAGATGAHHPAGQEPSFRCAKTELVIAFHVAFTTKAKQERDVEVSWHVFSDGFFDADALPAAAPPVSLKKLDAVAQASRKIASPE